ncbi:MAG: hypothetical protein LBF78_04560 [Treponema sp.]|nr:hypothetical protein [Treponema sp.]
MFQKITELDDDFWGGVYAFSTDPMGRVISPEDKFILSRKAQDCGKAMAQKTAAEYETAKIRELVKRAGLTIEKTTGAEHGGTIHFAEFAEPDKIRIYESCLEKTPLGEEQLSRDAKDLLASTEEVLITHELFHYLEYQQRDTIFTRTYVHHLRPILFFHPTARLLCISEIAAMAFIKEYLKLPCSPYVFDLLLIYGFNKDKAYRLYNNIINLAGNVQAPVQKPIIDTISN